MPPTPTIQPPQPPIPVVPPPPSNKRKTIIALIVTISILTALAAGYVLATKPQTPLPQIEPLKPTISIDQQKDQITFSIKTIKPIFVPEKGYWYQNGAWSIYKKTNQDWEKIVPGSRCGTNCERVCETGELNCVMGGSVPSCKSIESQETYIWDKQYRKLTNKQCDNGQTHQCSQSTPAEPGRYKVVFIYATACGQDNLFQEQSLSGANRIENEFELKESNLILPTNLPTYHQNSWKDIIPDTCTSFFDGCNQCGRDTNGIIRCTLRDCTEYDQPKCLDNNQPTQPIPNNFKISLQWGDIDTRESDAQLPEDLTIDNFPPGESGYYIVQFDNIILPEWRSALESIGAEIMGYTPNNAFLVRIPEDKSHKLAQVNHVQWVGIYHPAYRISPELKEVSNSPTTLTIMTFPGININSLTSQLQSWGGEVLSSYDDELAGSTRVEINPKYINQIANLNGVMWIEPYTTPAINPPIFQP